MIRLILALFLMLLGLCMGQLQGQSANPDAEAWKDQALASRVEGILDECLAFERTDEFLERFECLQDALRHARTLESQNAHALLHRLYRQAAISLSKLGALEEALAYDRKTLAHTSVLQEQQPFDHYRALSLYAIHHMELGRMDSAARIFADCAAFVKGRNPLWAASSLNNQGLLAYERRQLNDAASFFAQAIALLPLRNINDSMLWISIRDNQSDLLWEAGAHSPALDQVGENVDMLAQLDLRDSRYRTRYLRYTYKRVNWHLDLDQLAPARALLDRANALVRQIDGVDPMAGVEAAKLRYRFARRANNPELEAAAAETLMLLRDSVQQAELREQRSLSVGLARFGLEELEQHYEEQLTLRTQNAQIAERLAQSRLYMMLLIGLSGLLIALGIWQYWRTLAAKRKQEKEEAEQALVHRSTDVKLLAQELAQKQKLAEEILEQTHTIGQAEDQKVEEIVEQINNRLRAQSRVDAQRTWLRQEMDTVNEAFFARLEKHHAGLAKTELELCGLIRLGLGNREVADLRNIAPASARIARYRLKKKLGLEKDVDLGQYLKDIA